MSASLPERTGKDRVMPMDNANNYDNIDKKDTDGGAWFFEVDNEGEIKNTPLSTCVLLLNIMIGSGILIQPYVFREAGILVAIGEYFALGIVSFFGVDLLIWSGYKLDIYDYGLLAKATLGWYGDYLVDGAILITNIGSIISYVIIIGSLAQSVMLTYTTGGWYSEIPVLSGMIMGLLVYPICLIPKFGKLAFVSYFSVLAISATIVLVLIVGPQDASSYTSEPLNLGSFNGSIETLGSVVFAFGYAPAVFHSYETITPRRPELMSQVLFNTTAVGVSMCFIVGLVGEICFRDSTDSDILLNFSGTTGAVFKIAVIIHLIFYTPGEFIIMRHSMFSLMGLHIEELSEFAYILSTFVLLGVLTSTSCLMLIYLGSNEAFALVLNITGGLGSSITNFIVPGLIAMEALKDSDDDHFKGAFLAIFGVVIQLFVFISIIMTVYDVLRTDDDARGVGDWWTIDEW